MPGLDRTERPRRGLRWTRRRRSEPAMVFALALASCTTGPLPRLPQVEQATEAVQGGGDRYRAHRACGGGGAGGAPGALLREPGWGFLGPGARLPPTPGWPGTRPRRGGSHYGPG